MGRGGGDQGNPGQQDQRRESKQNHEMKHTAWGWYSKAKISERDCGVSSKRIGDFFGRFFAFRV